MTETKEEPKLREPGADALREALATAAEEISEKIGVRYIKHCSTTTPGASATPG